MAKQDTTHHTQVKQFRIPGPTMAAFDRIMARYGVCRTTALKMAVHAFDRRDSRNRDSRKNLEDSEDNH